jgi:glycosyltransferase involved in cell wall biosynthesis
VRLGADKAKLCADRGVNGVSSGMSTEATSTTREPRQGAPVRLVVDVCICTHNPRADLLAEVLAALAGQTAESESFRVILIDNTSEPPVRAEVLAPLHARGIDARIVVEQALGLTQARLRAAREAQGEWICFVDDDNVLAPNYLQVVLDHIRARPEAGAFGGRMLLPTSVQSPRWAAPFLPFLGIKDLGDDPQEALAPQWVECEPAGAGAVVHRSVMDAFCTLVTQRPAALELGRKGQGLASCDDSALMRGAYKLGRTVAYDPGLVLDHYINPSRLRFGYLMRLMYAYGESQVMLERILDTGVAHERHYASPIVAFRTLLSNFMRDCKKSVPFGIAMVGYHFSAWRAHRRLRASA